MPIHLRSSFGDGASLPLLPPGELVVVAVIPTSEIPRGPKLPLFLDGIPDALPSPTDTSFEDRFDLHEITGADSPSCFFLRVAGETMSGARIFGGDIVVVDRALTPASGRVVVVSAGDGLLLKRLVREGGADGEPGRMVLQAARPDNPPIEWHGEGESMVWGVVTASLHDLRSPKRRER